MIDRDRFKEILRPLMQIFKPLDEAQFEIYFDRFRWGDEGTFRLAAEKILDTHKFSSFPLPEAFREAIIEIEMGSVAGSETDYAYLDKEKCGLCGGMGRRIEYRDEQGNDVGWERRNEPGIQWIAAFCSCWYGKRLAKIQGAKGHRDQEKKKKRWYEPGEDREEAPF